MIGSQSMRHGHVVLAGWDCLLDLVHGGSAEVVVNGESLRLAKVVAVARLVILISLNFLCGQLSSECHGVSMWDSIALSCSQSHRHIFSEDLTVACSVLDYFHTP